MEQVQFISRHIPGPAQAATVQAAVGLELVHDPEKGNVQFHRDVDPAESLRAAGIESKLVAIVAPTWVQLALLRQGYILLEFVNMPSARERGVFLCHGAFVHSLAESRFVDSPVPIEEQEESALHPADKK